MARFPVRENRIDGGASAGKDGTASLEALYSISSTINGSLELDVVLRQALEKVLEVFDFPSGVVRLLDPPTGELTVAAAAGLSPELASEVRRTLRVGDSPSGLAVQRRAPVVVEDLRRSPYTDSVWARHGYRSFVSFPLQCRGMLLGCLNMSALRVRPLGAPEQELLTALAGQIGLAVANAELYTAAQRKIEYLSALHQWSQDIGPAPDLDRVLRLMTERLAHLLRLERTAVLDWMPETGELVGVAACGFPEDTIRALRAPLESLPLAASLLQEGQGLVSADPAGDGLLPAEFVRATRMHTALAVPLIAHDQPLGLLIGDRGEQPFYLSADEMELAMISANQASVWIANARLFIREQAARSEAEAAEVKYRGLLESAPDGIVTVDGEGRIVIVNSQTERMFGFTREELLGQPVEILMPERFRGPHLEHRGRYQSEPHTRPMGAGLNLYARRRNGTEFPVEISLSPMETESGLLVSAIIRDITERKRVEEERARLLQSEQEKSEQLKLSVREAHHRIKNNLQAITALLYMELSAGGDPLNGTGGDAIRESMERIQAIALVHDLLSQDEDVRTVDMRAVAERLVPMVLRSSGVASGSVQVEVAVPPVPLSSKKATALALIINELVSNAAKHAFAGGRAGRLQVHLQHVEGGLLLRIQDDGPGLPPEFDAAKHANVGLEVVRSLVERDLDGRLSMKSGPGVAAEVWFPW